MKVSIIIPTVGRPLLIKCLEHIRKLDYDDYETIIVSSGNTNPFRLKLNDREKLIYNSEGSVTHGTNLGAQAAVGDILAIVGDDVLVPQDWLKKSIRFFQNPDVAVVSGPNLTPPDSGFLERCFGYVHSSDFGSFIMSKRFRFSSTKVDADETELCGVALIRKSAFEMVGGFKLYGSCEENEFFHRLKEAGYLSVYTPEAFVYHYRRKNLKSFFDQIMKSGNGRIQYFKLHSHELMPKFFTLIPMFFLLYLFALPLLATYSRYFIFPIIIYSVCALLASINPASKEREWRVLAILPFLFFVQHVAYGHGSLMALFGYNVRKWK